MAITYPLDTIKLFYGYVREDLEFATKLGQSLIGLKRENFLETWSVAEIQAGSSVNQEIENHVAKADILLLLLSPVFLASDYCYHILLQRALQRHNVNEAIAVLILLKPVDWNEPDFSLLLRLPSTGEPISTWKRRDDAFHDIAQGIRALLKEVWLQKGDTYYKAKQYDMALYSFEEAIHQSPTFGSAYVRKGNVQRDMGLHHEAKESFELALRQNPADASLHFEIGASFYGAKEYSLAVPAFDRAIQLNHLLVIAHIYKGLALEQEGKLKQALEIYDNYLKIHPNDPLVSPFQCALFLRIKTAEYSSAIGQVSYNTDSLLSSISRSDFRRSPQSFDPLVPIIEIIRQFTSGLAFLLKDIAHLLENRLVTMDKVTDTLNQSYQKIAYSEEAINGILHAWINTELSILDNQKQQIREIFKGLQEMASVPIYSVDNVAKKLLNLLHMLSNGIEEEEHIQRNWSEQLVGILREQAMRRENYLLAPTKIISAGEG